MSPGGRLVRGAGTGVVAGALWWAVEWTANGALGGMLPLRAVASIFVLDVSAGAVAGMLAGLAAPSTPVRALVLTAAYGLLRIYEPPGLRAELLFVALAAVGVAVGVRLAGRERGGPLAFVHLTVVTVAAVVFGKAAVTEGQSYFAQTEPSAVTLLLLLAGLPLVGLAADRGLALVVRRRGVRFGVELAAAALAIGGWGVFPRTAPLEDPAPSIPAARNAPDVILVSLDTTRADHLSTYGYSRETSPNLTALARDALQFTHAYSSADWTVPGHASMLTGMYPSRHGAHTGAAPMAGSPVRRPRHVVPLGADKPTMAALLRARGYRTGAFVANFAALYRSLGFGQGFDHYDDAPAVVPNPVPHVVRLVQRFRPTFMKRPFRSAQEIVSTALAWLDGGPSDRPVFLFLNFLEPHHWMMPPAPFDRWAREVPGADGFARRTLFTHQLPVHLAPAERAFVAAAYDGQIALMDTALRALRAGLQARGRYENALVIVTADHGELLGEHDEVGHGGRMLYDGVLRIPMVVKLPGPDRPRGAFDGPVQLVDVLPTVLQALAAPIPPGVQGEPLPHVGHEIVAEEHVNPELVRHYGAVYDRAIRAIYDGPWKLIETSTGERLLFDLAHDPVEDENLVGREPTRTADLARRLAATAPSEAASVTMLPPRAY
jgi:arylsulfatase A-like enzyme